MHDQRRAVGRFLQHANEPIPAVLVGHIGFRSCNGFGHAFPPGPRASFKPDGRVVRFRLYDPDEFRHRVERRPKNDSFVLMFTADPAGVLPGLLPRSPTVVWRQENGQRWGDIDCLDRTTNLLSRDSVSGKHDRDVGVVVPRRTVGAGNGQSLEVIDEAVGFEHNEDVARPFRIIIPQHGFYDSCVGDPAIATRCWKPPARCHRIVATLPRPPASTTA